jgi:hypothetical protein
MTGFRFKRYTKADFKVSESDFVYPLRNPEVFLISEFRARFPGFEENEPINFSCAFGQLDFPRRVKPRVPGGVIIREFQGAPHNVRYVEIFKRMFQRIDVEDRFESY